MTATIKDAIAEAGEVRESLDDAVNRLAALPSRDYEQRRRTEAKCLGIRAAALDAMVRESKGGASTGSGSPLNLKDAEPWDHPVDGAALLDEIYEIFCRFIVAPPEALTAITLWALYTHCPDAFDINPLIVISSPQKRCGKTKTMKLLSGVVSRPLPGANVTSASIFRVIESDRPTMILDEADTFLTDNEEMRGVINSSHDRETAFVVRLVPTAGGDFEPRRFSTYTTIAIAIIQDPPDTVKDRAILVLLKRKLKSENAERYHHRHHADRLAILARKCARWAADNLGTLSACPDPADLPGLDDRAYDNWRPLRILAECAGGAWTARVAAAAVELSKERTAGQNDSIGEMLLSDLRVIFDEAPEKENLSSKEICEALHKLEDRPWPEYGRARKPITPTQLSKLLRPFKVSPVTIRLDAETAARLKAETAKGYKWTDLQDAFTRYEQPQAEPQAAEAEQAAPKPKHIDPDPFPGNAVTPSQPLGEKGFSDFFEPSHEPSQISAEPSHDHPGLGLEAAAPDAPNGSAPLEPPHEPHDGIAADDGWANDDDADRW